jgi:hypothetical protein
MAINILAIIIIILLIAIAAHFSLSSKLTYTNKRPDDSNSSKENSDEDSTR